MSDQSQSNRRLHAVVHGRVQGVGFRYAAVHKAQALDLTGWVRNTWDGTVETVAEGPRPALEQFLGWLRRGPTGARVERVEHTWKSATGEYRGFHVTYSP
ncbi:MAG: acylphosphatase [Anaerolineae bacterium]|nr:acylphosphatase [Anaerolineae bacterium]